LLRSWVKKFDKNPQVCYDYLACQNYQDKQDYQKGGEDVYHVALDLSQEQIKQLKVLAATNSITVKDLVTGLVVNEIKKGNKKEETEKV